MFVNTMGKNVKQIEFESVDDARKGFPIMLRAGTVVYTGTTGKYMIPEKTICVLKKKRLKFTIVS